MPKIKRNPFIPAPRNQAERDLQDHLDTMLDHPDCGCPTCLQHDRILASMGVPKTQMPEPTTEEPEPASDLQWGENSISIQFDVDGGDPVTLTGVTEPDGDYVLILAGRDLRTVAFETKDDIRRFATAMLTAFDANHPTNR